MKKIVILIFFITFSTIFSQTNIIIKIGDINADSTGKILVPINVNDFKSVGAISWKIKYDKSILSVVEAVNLHSELNDGYFTLSNKDDIITISWFSLDPADVGDNKLLDIKFNYVGGNTGLDFVDPSKTSNLQGELYNTNLQNGMIYDNTTEVKTDESINYYQLKQNYPNPFNPETNIDFRINKNSFVKVDVFSISGEKISTLVEQYFNSGKYSVNFVANNLSSGNYFYRLLAFPEDNSAPFTSYKKMTLLH